MKKTLTTLALATAAVLVSAPAAAAITLSFTPSATHINVGSGLTIQVGISGLDAEILSGFDLNFLYNPAVLSLGSFTYSGAALGTQTALNSITVAGSPHASTMPLASQITAWPRWRLSSNPPRQSSAIGCGCAMQVPRHRCAILCPEGFRGLVFSRYGWDIGLNRSAPQEKAVRAKGCGAEAGRQLGGCVRHDFPFRSHACGCRNQLCRYGQLRPQLCAGIHQPGRHDPVDARLTDSTWIGYFPKAHSVIQGGHSKETVFCHG